MAEKLTGRWFQDMLERVAWTALEAGIALAAREVADLEYGWVPVIAAGLAYLKAEVAKRVGDPNSASTLKAEKEPVG